MASVEQSSARWDHKQLLSVFSVRPLSFLLIRGLRGTELLGYRQQQGRLPEVDHVRVPETPPLGRRSAEHRGPWEPSEPPSFVEAMRLAVLLFLLAEGLRDELLERASGDLDPVDLDGTVVKTL